MIWLIFDSVIYIVETILLMFLARQLLSDRRPGRLRAGVYTGLLVVIHKAIALVFCGFVVLTAAGSGLADYIIFGILWRQQWYKRLFIICFYYALMITIDLLLIFAVPVLAVPLNLEQYQLFGMVVSRLLLALVVGLTGMLQRGGNKGKNLFVCIVPLPVLIIIALLFSYFGHEVTDVMPSQNLDLAVLMILIMVLILCYICIQLTRNEEVLWQRLRMQEELRAGQEKYCAAVLENYASIRSTKHDLHHYLDTIAALIDTGQYEAAQNICSHALGRTGVSLIYTGNETVDAIIYSKQALYEQAGAVLTVEGPLPRVLEYDGADICIVLSNALENAAEAVAQLPGEHRRVLVRFRYDGWLLITVENMTAAGTDRRNGGSRYQSPKGPDHGLGIDNMAAACKRQNGYLETEIKDGVFILAATMQPKE